MDKYLAYVVENLESQEAEILRILFENGATVKYKGMPNPRLMEEAGLQPSRYRGALVRLNAMRFIEVCAGAREHIVYINEYGKQVLSLILDDNNAV